MEALRLLFDAISWMILGIITVTSISLAITLFFLFVQKSMERLKKVNWYNQLNKPLKAYHGHKNNLKTSSLLLCRDDKPNQRENHEKFNWQVLPR